MRGIALCAGKQLWRIAVSDAGFQLNPRAIYTVANRLSIILSMSSISNAHCCATASVQRLLNQNGLAAYRGDEL